LCKAGVHERMIFGMADCCTPSDMQRIIKGAVAMFMAMYRAS
jgi:TetR/AcrR family transcriptional regulator, mexJK operon transcriptional repressor